MIARFFNMFIFLDQILSFFYDIIQCLLKEKNLDI
ncbi:hypothetical protein BHO_0900061 (plasmid) [Borrelia hermsii YBT]|uniref:Uncharacterized protein n=1 Tax=Borrelia hermsii YBT TaxID=1313295 RepID=W5T1X8_BORHE|nr:hypothetical protein BHO_0900061 [Borrelia hermsii YBT]